LALKAERKFISSSVSIYFSQIFKVDGNLIICAAAQNVKQHCLMNLKQFISKQKSLLIKTFQGKEEYFGDRKDKRMKVINFMVINGKFPPTNI
jgi:hypothetical protein